MDYVPDVTKKKSSVSDFRQYINEYIIHRHQIKLNMYVHLRRGHPR